MFVLDPAFGSHVEDREQGLYLAMVLADNGSGVYFSFASLET